jgi:small-conductance mechanosensitive channel
MDIQAAGQSAFIQETGRAETARSNEYARFLQAMDTFTQCLERARRREQEKAEEAAAERQAKEKQKKVNELYALISQLRQKLAASGGKDAGIRALLDQAQTELFWLLFGMSP